MGRIGRKPNSGAAFGNAANFVQADGHTPKVQDLCMLPVHRDSEEGSLRLYSWPFMAAKGMKKRAALSIKSGCCGQLGALQAAPRETERRNGA
jgi:hypothetical protein